MTRLQPRREFAALLDKARRDQHLSIRGLAGIVGIPHSTVQGWLNGRSFPTPALRPDYLRVVEKLGLSDALSDDLWADATTVAAGACAVPGTASVHRVGRGPQFRPRQRVETPGRVGGGSRKLPAGIVVVVGAPGAGKGSLLAAGLIGGEAADGLLAGWTTCAALRPSDLPAAAVAAKLVVVDQFEDVFTMAPDERAEIMEALDAVATRSVVVVGIRADAFGNASHEPVLIAALEHLSRFRP